MAHIHELIDYTSEVYNVYQDKVLLRKHDKYKIWLSVGGHIELDEDPNKAAVREVKEEVGLDVELDDTLRPPIEDNDRYQELIPPYFMNIHKIGDTHKHITLVYFAKALTDKITQIADGEVSEECRWFTKDELENLEDIQESVKYYATKALEKLSRSKLSLNLKKQQQFPFFDSRKQL